MRRPGFHVLEFGGFRKVARTPGREKLLLSSALSRSIQENPRDVAFSWKPRPVAISFGEAAGGSAPAGSGRHGRLRRVRAFRGRGVERPRPRGIGPAAPLRPHPDAASSGRCAALPGYSPSRHHFALVVQGHRHRSQLRPASRPPHRARRGVLLGLPPAADRGRVDRAETVAA
jgi:hypothetical protein